MDYRPLSEQDIERYVALERYAFQANPDRSSLDAARMAGMRGLFLGDTLVAQLELIPHRVRSGAGTLTAMGIGAVAGAPELRRRGHVATLLRHLADELRASHVPLAILFPFKTSFYARYGWATFCERRRYTGAPALFTPFRLGSGSFAPVGPEAIPELDRIYTMALRGRFGPVVRDEAWWRGQVLKDWHGTPFHAYLWRDDQGQARAYLLFRFEGEGRSGQLACREIVALDPTARAQLFAFLAGHQDQLASVRFHAPADAPVNLLFPDPLECVAEPYFMLRLLDVPAAMESYAFPRDVAGRLMIDVRDDWIAENQAVFALEFAEGRCAVTRLPAGSPADLRCDIRALAQLYSRYLRPRTAAAFGVIEVDSREGLELAERAFAGLAPFSSDFF